MCETGFKRLVRAQIVSITRERDAWQRLLSLHLVHMWPP